MIARSVRRATPVRATALSSAPNLRQRFKAATKEAILDAAEKTLDDRGAAEACISDIATRAGVSVGTLYNHFKDRDAILEALLEERGKEMVQRIDVALEEVDGRPFRARLIAFATAILRHVYEHPGLLRIVLEDHLHGGSVRRRRLQEQVHRRATSLTRDGIREGALRRGDAKLYPFLLLGLLRGAFVYLMAGGNPRGSSEALARSVSAAFFDGARAS
jgi:AcrR family transcriptional regulator